MTLQCTLHLYICYFYVMPQCHRVMTDVSAICPSMLTQPADAFECILHSQVSGFHVMPHGHKLVADVFADQC